MKRIFLILTIILLIYFSGCVQTPIVECSNDNACVTGGCSNQLCGKKGEIENIVTTCEWKEEYDCLKLTQCKCIENKCQWEQTQEYQQCLANLTH